MFLTGNTRFKLLQMVRDIIVSRSKKSLLVRLRIY